MYPQLINFGTNVNAYNHAVTDFTMYIYFQTLAIMLFRYENQIIYAQWKGFRFLSIILYIIIIISKEKF